MASHGCHLRSPVQSKPNQAFAYHRDAPLPLQEKVRAPQPPPRANSVMDRCCVPMPPSVSVPFPGWAVPYVPADAQGQPNRYPELGIGKPRFLPPVAKETAHMAAIYQDDIPNYVVKAHRAESVRRDCMDREEQLQGELAEERESSARLAARSEQLEASLARMESAAVEKHFDLDAARQREELLKKELAQMQESLMQLANQVELPVAYCSETDVNTFLSSLGRSKAKAAASVKQSTSLGQNLSDCVGSYLGKSPSAKHDAWTPSQTSASHAADGQGSPSVRAEPDSACRPGQELARPYEPSVPGKSSGSIHDIVRTEVAALLRTCQARLQ